MVVKTNQTGWKLGMRRRGWGVGLSVGTCSRNSRSLDQVIPISIPTADIGREYPRPSEAAPDKQGEEDSGESGNRELEISPTIFMQRNLS